MTVTIAMCQCVCRYGTCIQVWSTTVPCFLFSSLQDNNTVERTFGDAAVKRRYSHIDLVYMVDGVDMQRGTVTAGNRCYYLKVGVVRIDGCVFVGMMSLRNLGETFSSQNSMPQPLLPILLLIIFRQ